MATSVINEFFPGFIQPFNGKNISVVKRSNRKVFDQPIPSEKRRTAFGSADYYLDSLSEIVSSQSLSPKQIAESKSKKVDEKLNTLINKYVVAKTDEVKKFLLKNQILYSLIEEIPNKISQYFGNNQRLSLKLSHEPDYPNSSELWIFVMTELSAKEALPILEKFDEEWWFEKLDLADCKLNISLEYI